MPDENSAIGIFDSGVGGLTVFRQVAERLPQESIVYLGDTARVPYGTKSADTVVRYAHACAKVLLERDIKLLVVACNTASAFALDALREDLGIPVLGVIEPGARAALRQTRSKRVGVIGTTGTISSGAYPRCLVAADASVQVFAQACPLFVPLAEEGWTEGDIPERVAKTYLDGLIAQDIDTLVLGCTHYPLLRATIGQAAGPGVCIVDSAEETAAVVEATLEGMQLHCKAPFAPVHRFLVSDAPETFAPVGRRFLGQELNNVEWVDF